MAATRWPGSFRTALFKKNAFSCPRSAVGSKATATSSSASNGRRSGSRIHISRPTSGATHHANVTYNGKSASRVHGTVFEVTDAELAATDQYEEPADYTRITATLASGKETWVYVYRASIQEE